MTVTDRITALKEDKKFINKAFWAYNWSIPMCFTRERMLGSSVVSMFARVAEDIYPDELEKQQELCRNHEVFFNTQQGLGAVIYGVILGMEVERAESDLITNELIQSIKQALAGPLAGLGDSLIQALVTPILISISIGMSSASGSLMGPIFLFASYTIINGLMSYILFVQGFKSGVLGITVIGGVLAGIMNVKTGLVASFGETVVNIQTDVLDAFFPKILSLIVCFIVYYLIKDKKWSATKIMLWMIPVAIIGFLTHILA